MEVGIARTVPLERDPRRVELEAVHLDNETLCPPQEVDLMPAGPGVYGRVWELSLPDQVKEATLGLGASDSGATWRVQQPS